MEKDDVWYVVYVHYPSDDVRIRDFCHFVGGFLEEKDAKAFMKLKKRENANSIRSGFLDFFIETRPMFK